MGVGRMTNTAASWTWKLDMVRLLFGNLVRSRAPVSGLDRYVFALPRQPLPAAAACTQAISPAESEGMGPVAEGNFSFFQQIQEVAVRNVEHFRGFAGGSFFFFHRREAEIRFRMNRRYRRLRSQFDPEGVGPLVTAPVFPFPNRTWLPAGRPFARRMLFETCRVDFEASESAPVSTRLESLQEVPLAGGAVEGRGAGVPRSAPRALSPSSTCGQRTRCPLGLVYTPWG